MTLERAAAKMVCAGFHGTTVPPELDDLIARGIGGIVFFSRNVESPQQFADLAADLKDRAKGRALLTSIDQEGGRVMRLREPFTIIPPMRAVGAAGDAELAREIGRVLGRELRAVNIDMNLAPVLDVDTNPDNPVIGARSFGRDADLVSRMGCALLQGLQAEGVAACGKHFPGHGDTSQDSHHDLPRLDHPMERLLTVELRPFKEALRCGIAAIMSAHVIFAPIDNQYPATLSPLVLDGLLRKRLMYDGVIISDAMDMKAIADHFGFDDAIVRGARAGIDLFMLCHSHEQQYRAIEVLVKAIESGDLAKGRLEQAGERLDRLFAKYVKPPTRGPLPAFIGSAEHRTVAQRVIELSDPAAQAMSHDPTEPA
ncbi:MAG: beta-N-acetylhexosaminidase [Tepidisphaeraceae bacterium]